MDKVLTQIYFDVKNPGSFGGVNKLFVEARKHLPHLTRKDVSNWLRDQLTYSLHRQIRSNFRRNRILVQRKNEQFEADLVDMQMFSRQNNGFKYIITIIDCFSKFMYAYPIKNKTSAEIIKCFKDLFKNVVPQKLRTDRGLEFDNVKVKKFLKDNNVEYFTSNDSKIKCAIVERANRTLKSKMFRYFTARGTRKYIDILEDLVRSYNHTYHRTIKMRPVDVSDENREEVFENIYKVGNYREFFEQEKFKRNNNIKPGDNVRVKYDLNKSMEKSYYPLWSDTVYKVDQIVDRPKQNYKLTLEGHPLTRA